MKLNPEQLLSFAALVETGSVGAAARRRHLTQPAISNQLKRLQQTVGVPLYRRAGRGVALTGAGERFYRAALAVRQSIREAEVLAEALRGDKAGRVHVAASQTIAGALLPEALVRFRERMPGVEVFVHSMNSREVFREMENHDLGLVECPLESMVPECCEVEPLGKDAIVAVMHREHPLAEHSAVTLEELVRWPLIWREEGSGTREALEQALVNAMGRIPQPHWVLGGVAAVLEAARQRLGVSVVSQFCVPSGETVLAVRPLRPALSRPMSLLRPGHASALALRFADFLVAHLRARMLAAAGPDDSKESGC